MKIILNILLLLFCLKVTAQTINYSYIDPCTGVLKQLTVPDNGITVTYFNQIKTFSKDDFTNGSFTSWASGVYNQYGQNNPCGSTIGISNSIDIGQSTALNVIGILNSLSAISDIQGSTTSGSGMIDITSGLMGSSKSTNKKENKKNKDSNNNSESSNSNLQQPNSTLSNGQINSQGSEPSQNQNSSDAGTTNNTESNNTSNTGNETNSNSNTNGTEGSNNNQNSEGATQPNSNNDKSTGTSNANTPTNPSTNVQGGNSSSSNSTTESGGSQAEPTVNNNSNSENSNTTNQQTETQTPENSSTNSTTNTNSETSNAPDQTSGSEATNTEKKSTNILGGTVNSIANASGKSQGNKPTVVLSSDFTGFNFKNNDVVYGGKATGGFTSMRWDGRRTHGFLVDYTSITRGPNVTAFYAFINKKRIDLLSLTGTASFYGKGSIYGTLALGQMWSIKKNAKVLYLATASWGYVYQESFIGTAFITGGMYDWKVAKRLDIKMMGLFIYAPFVSYYNDIVLKSPYVVMPVIGTNIGITKKFKLNINMSGTYAIKEDVLNFTVMLGTRFAL